MKTSVKIVLILLILGVLTEAGYLIYKKFFKTQKSETVSLSKKVSIPDNLLANKFGFLSGGEKDTDFIKSVGAGWVRPDSPFLWDSMQKSKTSDIDFSKTDALVSKYQEKDLAILATIWPFADWDQKTKTNWSKCQVSSSDENLPQNNKKGRDSYLPLYRCNPSDWNLYLSWVKAVVERYDGDGIGDMPDLKIPIKYWEIMNEPDLEGNDTLDFYKEGAAAYTQLLIKTSQAIREADSEAKILIAGAAGGSDRFLNFYKTVFSNPQAQSAFDIGNVHCISNDSFQSFNVEPYKKLLLKYKLEKPIWVTEAEAMVSSNPDANASQTFSSTKKALSLGTERIFFTRYEFEISSNKLPPKQEAAIKVSEEIDGSDPVKAYQQIISQSESE